MLISTTDLHGYLIFTHKMIRFGLQVFLSNVKHFQTFRLTSYSGRSSLIYHTLYLLFLQPSFSARFTPRIVYLYPIVLKNMLLRIIILFLCNRVIIGKCLGVKFLEIQKFKNYEKNFLGTWLDETGFGNFWVKLKFSTFQ